MNCSYCNCLVEPNQKYLAFFDDQPNGGIRIEVGCKHYQPADLDKAAAVAGGAACAEKLFVKWMTNLRCGQMKGQPFQ